MLAAINKDNIISITAALILDIQSPLHATDFSLS